jgi:phage terminase large subunit-like protein
VTSTLVPPPSAPSVAEQVAETLARVPVEDRPGAWGRIVGELPGGDAYGRSWAFWCRPEQLPPGHPLGTMPDVDVLSWRWWCIVTGRGWGKTRTAAEWVADRCETFALAAYRTGRGKGSRLHRVLLVGPTAADVRDTMVEGESGLLAAFERRGYHAHYEPSKLRITVAALRTVITLRSGERPDRIRGGQYHTAWIEEFAAFPLKLDEVGESAALSNADLALRLPCPDGMVPQAVVTTTPKPLPPVKALLDRVQVPGSGVIRTAGSLYANLRNLAPAFVKAILDRYEGTRLGDQEVHGIMLSIVEGALWTPDGIDEHRVAAPPDLDLIVVGVDPHGGGRHGVCGIVVVGADLRTREVYVLDDRSLSGPPETWGAQVVAAHYAWGSSTVVAETNFGGDMVRAVIQATDRTVPVKVVTASKGKQARAEPIATLGARGKVHLVGYHGLLESQMTSWVPGDPSPDRLDAMVWAATELFGDLVLPPARASAPKRGAGGRRRGASWSPS